ncbi:MAG: NifB/NifX family molybdenum-iron cluster-binding protein [Anaerolineales bacterium]|jgi:predicted Fe-Mo cluster-binding NifX family protein
MKIAVVTDDEKNISTHFGQARYYIVLTVQDGEVTRQETRPKVNQKQFAGEHHHYGEHGEPHGMDRQAQHRHARMMDTIDDCQVLISRGMRQGAQYSLTARGIQPVLTDIQDIREAVNAYLAGTLVENMSLVS